MRGKTAVPRQHVGALTLDPGTRSARLEDAPLDLSPREYALLETLARKGARQLEATAFDTSPEALARAKQSLESAGYPPQAT